MNSRINATQLRTSLRHVVTGVGKGARYTVIYRGRAAFRIIPLDAPDDVPDSLENDTLYEAAPVGRSTDGGIAACHDAALYGG